jgi:hypothetical protein
MGAERDAASPSYGAEEIAMNEELTWAEIVKSGVALGLITSNGSKAEALKVHDMLKKQMEGGRVEHPLVAATGSSLFPVCWTSQRQMTTAEHGGQCPLQRGYVIPRPR